jgi:hypothetical protein
MDLWTEFEGVTIDKAYSLSKLLQTEGRSAFFSTSNANGDPVLIRIIECHFDEDEILARWRGVQTLGHPSFLRIEHFGQFLIEADDITAVYAVFERVDANLGDVLLQGRLPLEDAAQIGLSLTSALETLHTNGFVHEHVEARNIYAVGETVKLRSDCIRETPEGERGVAARRRDVHDLAVVLMQVLTGNPRAVDPPRAGTLVARFDEIVRKGMSGEWGLKEIQAALSPYKAATASKAAPAKQATPQPAVAKTVPAPASGAPTIQAPPVPAQKAEAKVSPEPQRVEPEKKTEPQSKPQATFRPRPEPWADPQGARRRTQERTPFPGPDQPFLNVQGWLDTVMREPRKWITAGALLLAVVILGWMVLRRPSAHSAAIPAAATKTADRTPSTPAPQPRATMPQHPATRPIISVPASTTGNKQWRVVAFTYNREDQARKKASSLAQKHPDLQPQVFSPSGRAPYLVTIGGAQQRDEAYALARKARSLGLPRDTYAQNYTAR